MNSDELLDYARETVACSPAPLSIYQRMSRRRATLEALIGVALASGLVGALQLSDTPASGAIRLPLSLDTARLLAKAEVTR